MTDQPCTHVQTFTGFCYTCNPVEPSTPAPSGANQRAVDRALRLPRRAGGDPMTDVDQLRVDNSGGVGEDVPMTDTSTGKFELVVAVLSAHIMTTSSRTSGPIRNHVRHCMACGTDQELPWRDWEAALTEHQANVLVERLGL